MPAPDTITVSQLSRLVGLPDAPLLLDVRTEEDYATDPRLLPASFRRDARSVTSWAADYAGRPVVVICQRGLKLSQGVAAWLRQSGARAEVLDGGFEAWVKSAGDGMLLRPDHIPPRNAQGRTVWVTRARPKIDRIACPWLIRRFVDPSAVFLFVAPSEVTAVAERFNATPFDIEEVFWSHRGDRCTFDAMVEEFGLGSEALNRLALIVRGADTARPDLVPESAGLLAASLGLSRMYRDDLAQLDAAMGLYDSFFRWSRDAVAETHNWPTGNHKGAKA
ncbi:chromate resistance protein ChrB domain-containing protein [Roseicella sp. DB1501]|uniref:chromate resistance protein ChrB domain-containing protein n=1 Tax=Roseicella sp. DB1501 TaxID=2730925 RepID=UPI001490F7D5|nr:chromate resistance protein ChrB domain-containing protein [Roseicella sp. DB1501]NOG73361.1 sulfurtransferase [Roseicella sp. DB1501]